MEGYLSKKYYSKSECNNMTGVSAHLLLCCSPGHGVSHRIYVEGPLCNWTYYRDKWKNPHKESPLYVCIIYLFYFLVINKIVYLLGLVRILTLLSSTLSKSKYVFNGDICK